MHRSEYSDSRQDDLLLILGVMRTSYMAEARVPMQRCRMAVVAVQVQESYTRDVRRQ
jgi:hypothetical protein